MIEIYSIPVSFVPFHPFRKASVLVVLVFFIPLQYLAALVVSGVASATIGTVLGFRFGHSFDL